MMNIIGAVEAEEEQKAFTFLMSTLEGVVKKKPASNRQDWRKVVNCNIILAGYMMGRAENNGIKEKEKVFQKQLEKYRKDNMTGEFGDWWIVPSEIQGAMFFKHDVNGDKESTGSYGYILPLGVYGFVCEGEGKDKPTLYLDVDNRDRKIAYENYRSNRGRDARREKTSDVIFVPIGSFIGTSYETIAPKWIFVAREPLSRMGFYHVLKDCINEKNADYFEGEENWFVLSLKLIFDRLSEKYGIDISGADKNTSIKMRLNFVINEMIKKDIKSNYCLTFLGKFKTDWDEVGKELQLYYNNKNDGTILSFPFKVFSKVPKSFKNAYSKEKTLDGESEYVILPCYIPEEYRPKDSE